MRRIGMAGFALALAVGVAPPTPAAAYDSTRIGFGFPEADVGFIEGQGVNLTYGSVWAENWAIEHDYSNIRDTIQDNKALGVTTVILWYYWGDKISKTCVENWDNTSLCDRGKTRQKWMSEAGELAWVVNDELQKLGGGEAVVILEPEFHKDGDPDSEDTDKLESLDGYLAEQAGIFDDYASIKTVVGYGEWADAEQFNVFDRVTNAVDYVGTQILFSCVRQTQAAYTGAVERIVSRATEYETRWPSKPVFVYDWGMSSYSGQSSGDELYWSYPQPRDCLTAGNYDTHQESELQDIFDSKQALKDRGVIAIIFRTLNDEVNRTAENDYHRIAERWFGIRRVDDGVVTVKPAYNNVMAGITAENNSSPGPGPGPDPGTSEWRQEAEAFTTKTVGGQNDDTTASGGWYWNLWGNGYIGNSMTATTAGEKQIRIVARGNVAGGVWPVMRVVVDGVVVSEQSVTTTSWATYTVNRTLTAGSHTVQVHFLNDALVGTEDRNLKLDVVSLHPVGVAEQWAQEAESFTTKTTGVQNDDTTASGGWYWNIWSFGYISTSATSPTGGSDEIRIRARGNVAGGVWPNMRVHVDGVVVANVTVNTTTWVTYTVPTAISAGAHTLKIEFTNDAQIGTEDRNLKVDRASLWG